MNITTGEIVKLTEEDYAKLFQEEKNDLVPLEASLTKKQEKEMKVSLHDTRSPAGNQLHAERKRRGLTRNQKKRLKRKGVIK